MWDNAKSSLFEAGFFWERDTHMTRILAMLVALLATACGAIAQENSRNGIVTQDGVVTMEVIRKKVSVRGFRTLQIGDWCDLLPGDLILFIERDGEFDIVRRMGPSKLSIGMLKGLANIGTSKTCPLNAVGKVPTGFREQWIKTYEKEYPPTSKTASPKT